MSRIREWFGRLWSSVRGNPHDAEMAKELELHLALAIDDMRRRMGPTPDAVRAAHLQVGGVAQAMDALRDQRGLPWLTDAVQDLRHAFRMMRRTPGFAIVACVTLALGIGANTAIFSLVNVLVWRDLPVREPERLVQLTWQYPGDPQLNFFNVPDYERFRDGNDVFSDLIGTMPSSVRSGTASLNTESVTPNFFDALDLRPALGRLLAPSDGAAGADPVAVIGWAYWRNRLNLDPRVLGSRIRVGDVSASVIGVAPREFSSLLTGYRTDVWIPAAVDSTSRQTPLMLMGRLKKGVSIERARAEMRVLDRPRIEAFARNDPQWRNVNLEVESARSGFSTPLHQQFEKPLLVVMAIVAVLLLLTCANVGSMLLARAAARQKEMAVRVSLGASRLRIMRQLLTESLLLSAIGSLIGVIGAYFGTRVLVRIMVSGTRLVGTAPSLDVPVDAPVLLFTAGAAVLAAVLFGVVPAWAAFASAPASSVRVTGASREPGSRRLFGNGLVVAQVALSLLLLSVAGVYIRHLSTLRSANLGFDRTSVLLVSLDTASSTGDREQSVHVRKDLLERFGALPGVRSATVSGMTPISGAAGSRFVTVDGVQEEPAARRRVMLNAVAPRYFETFGTPLISGRDFQSADTGGARVAIVNEAMARHYFADRSPLGRQLLLEGDSRPYEIVGVAADAKYADLRAVAPRTIYLDAFQQNRLPSEFALRTSVAPRSLSAQVRHLVDDVGGSVSVSKVTTLEEQLDASIVPERLISTLSGFFGGLGALLAAVGLYGLLAYTVARRTTDIGIRMALGATRRDVIRMVIGQALSLVCAGLLVGMPMALWGRRIAAGVLDGMPEASVLPDAAAAVVMLAVALLAAYMPARRASRVEPLVALRSE